MQDVHGTVHVPQGGTWLRRVLAFTGPAYLVSVGYMDPGNWATDLAAGSRFEYRLIWVLLMSNLMAVLLQTLSARLGVVTGRDLAQACHDSYGKALRGLLFVLCEIAIAACDLAEVLGTAIGIHMLFPAIPLLAAVLITGLDVLLLLGMQRWGMRKMEMFIVSLISIIGICFVVEIFLCKPAWGMIGAGFVPSPLSSIGGENSSLYIAISIIGATVMPHNLYLHSSLVQSRRLDPSEAGRRQACRFNLLDSAVALNIAFFVNAAILIVAAATFGHSGHPVDELEDAHRLLHDLLGTRVAPIVFALALICAGQSSTITGTLAGQITMEGFLRFRMRPWLRRLTTRLMAIVPAVLVIAFSHDNGTNRLLVLSQVILSLQLPFAMVPLVKFTSSRARMGNFVNPKWLAGLAWIVATIIILLNGKLVVDQFRDWQNDLGNSEWIIRFIAYPAAFVMAAVLAWLILRPERQAAPSRETLHVSPPSAAQILDAAQTQKQHFHRIGVALEAKLDDAAMLGQAIALARAHRAELVLMHIVEGAAGQWHGAEAGDAEARHDDEYLNSLATRLRSEVPIEEVPEIRTALGFGDVKRELIRLARQQKLDLLVAGGHGHRKLGDLLRGETINGVRHHLDIPVLAIRSTGKKDASA